MGSTFGRQYAVTTRRHQELVVDMIRALQARGDVRPDLDSEEVAHFLFSMKSKLFMDFVSDDAMSLQAHREEVRKGVRHFLQGTSVLAGAATKKGR